MAIFLAHPLVKRALGRHTPRMTSPARVGALVLAAGTSSRMGGANKLIAHFDGKAVIRHVMSAVLASHVVEVTVVTGHDADLVERELGSMPVRLVHNPDYELGMSSSIRVGLIALGPGLDAFVICLGDMPRVSAAHIDALIAAFDASDRSRVCVPTYDGRRGNPVLWPIQWLLPLQSLQGDAGARQYLDVTMLEEVPMKDGGVLLDVDTPGDLATLSH